MSGNELPMVQSWRCEACGQPVVAADGRVMWPHLPDCTIQAPFEYRILHAGLCAKQASRFVHSMALRELLGADGLARLTAMLSEGVAAGGAVISNPRTPPGAPPTDAWVDLFRRLHLPGYEQARQAYLMGLRNDFAGRPEGAVAPYLQSGFAAFSQWSQRVMEDAEARVNNPEPVPRVSYEPEEVAANDATRDEPGAAFDLERALAETCRAVRAAER